MFKRKTTSRNKSLTSFEEFLNAEVGKPGTKERRKYEEGYKAFERRITRAANN
jgi:hypothetical protein